MARQVESDAIPVGAQVPQQARIDVVDRFRLPETGGVDAELRWQQLLRKYRAYRAANNDRTPIYYRGRDKWEPIPAEFLNRTRP